MPNIFLYHTPCLGNFNSPKHERGPDSSAAIVTCYGLAGSGFETYGGKTFSLSIHLQTEPGAHPASSTMDTGFIPRGKAAGACR
jgi:hypothetical protein